MKVLIVGGGGRENELAANLSNNPLVSAIYWAGGNLNVVKHPKIKCAQIILTDIKSLTEFADAFGIALTIVGHQPSLASGIVKAFEARNLSIIESDKIAARLLGAEE